MRRHNGGHLSVALLQMDAGSADANIGKALGMARGLSQPADVLVLPELWAGGDPADSPRALEAVKAICAELGTFAVAGALPWRSQDGVSLRAWIVNDAGAAFSWYDKTHIPSTGEAYKAGESPLIFDAGGISCGVAIGYDILFPEFTRSIALAGAGVIFVPARWPESRRDAWAPILRSAAATGQVYVAACGASGGLEKSFFGGSSLVSPSGAEIASLGMEEGTLERVLDLAEIGKRRKNDPLEPDRRPRLYRLLTG